VRKEWDLNYKKGNKEINNKNIEKLKEKLYLMINEEMEKIEYEEMKNRINKIKEGKENYMIEDLLEKNNDFYFYIVKNREIKKEESGLKKIFDVLCSEYDNVKHGVSADLKHKMVYEIIEKLSKNENFEDEIENEIENQKIPFIEVNEIKNILKKIEKGEKIDNITFGEEGEDDESERNIAKDSFNKIETILSDLHKLGVIIYFNDKSLKDIVVSDPKWFNKVKKNS
jgi:hypothetical protein